MNKLRAALYLRQSTFKEESISLELQETACRTYAQQQGYDVVAVESDPGISGRTFKRPGVTKVMNLIERKDAEVIVLWKWSRLSRSRLDWAVAADKVETIGGRIESATEQVDVSTSTGRLARGMLTEFAAFESERIGDTWKETHARRIKKGLPHNAPKHFGYTYTRDDGYAPDEHEGAVLRQLYVRFTAGATFRELGAYAASEGFEPESGWRNGGIRRMLDRGFGAGYLWVKGELVKGAHEPVITELEWDAYQVRRGQRAGRPRAESSDYPYSGLLKCFCGSPMGGNSITRGGNTYRRYLCLNSVQKGTHSQVTVSEPYVEDAVLEWLKGVASEVDVEASKVQPPQKPNNIERTRKSIDTEIGKIITRIDSLTLKYLDEKISTETYTRMNQDLEDAKAALEARLRLLEVNTTAKTRTVAPMLLKQWPTLPARGKRASLGTLVAEIRMHDWESERRSGRRKISVTEHEWE